MKDLIRILLISAGVIVLIALLVYLDTGDANTTAKTEGETEQSATEMMGTPLTEDELVESVEEFLAIYHQLYFITLDDSPAAETDDAIILSFLTETMNDKNKLEGLMSRITPLSSHPNLMIAANGTALQAGVGQLITAHNNFITYLRGVDSSNVNISEFQYQYTLLQTESKDAFLMIAEGSSSLNLAYFDFTAGMGDDRPVLIGTASQDRLLSEIDRLFGEIFVEHEEWRKETSNVNTPVYIVEQWKDWIRDLGPTKP